MPPGGHSAWSSRRDVHRVPVQIGPISNGIADVDPNTKSDGSVEGLVAIVDWYLLLNRHGTAHSAVDAVEHGKQGIAPRLNDPAAVLLDGPVYQIGAEGAQTLQCSGVIQPDQAAVAHHIGIDHCDQLPPILELSMRVVIGHRHYGPPRGRIDVASCGG